MVMDFRVILAYFFSAVAILLSATWIWSGRKKALTLGERAMMCWFVTSGLIHLILEGTVVATPKFYQDKSGNIIHEIWKEYAKADSRYATRDDFIITMEGCCSFFGGPLCLACVYAIWARKPWRYTAMLTVSLVQFYGVVLYFLTCWHGGWMRHTRPEFLYFWFYFVIINSVWAVVPIMIMWHSVAVLNAAVAGGKKSKTR